MDETLVRAFVKRLHRTGPLGEAVCRGLEYAVPETRQECQRIATQSGYLCVARNALLRGIVKA